MLDRRNRLGLVSGVFVSVLVVWASPVKGGADCTYGTDCINLAFDPEDLAGCPGEEVQIGFVLDRDWAGCPSEPHPDPPDPEEPPPPPYPLGCSVAVVKTILWWDPEELELLGTLHNGPYQWRTQPVHFPDDSGLDGLNFPCDGTLGCIPENDGNAWYWAWARIGVPALIPAEGLLVVTFRFRLLDPGSVNLAILEGGAGQGFDPNTITRVLDGESAAMDMTGFMPSPATVSGCQPPVVAAVGPRYLSVTPEPCDTPMAFLVSRSSCVDLYLQADGTLGPGAVRQTPTQWGGTVYLSDDEIVSGAPFQVRTECGAAGSGVSPVVSATTWAWADTNNSGGARPVDLDDILRVLDASQGIYVPPAIIENSDLAPCVPDREINLDDIISVLDGFAGFPYPCIDPC